MASGQGPQIKKCSRMKNADGSVVIDADKIRKRWAEHVFGLLNVSEEATYELILEELGQRVINEAAGALPTGGKAGLHSLILRIAKALDPTECQHNSLSFC